MKFVSVHLNEKKRDASFGMLYIFAFACCEIPIISDIAFIFCKSSYFISILRLEKEILTMKVAFLNIYEDISNIWIGDKERSILFIKKSYFFFSLSIYHELKLKGNYAKKNDKKI